MGGRDGPGHSVAGGVRIYDLRFTIYDLRFTIYDCRFENTTQLLRLLAHDAVDLRAGIVLQDVPVAAGDQIKRQVVG